MSRCKFHRFIGAELQQRRRHVNANVIVNVGCSWWLRMDQNQHMETTHRSVFIFDIRGDGVGGVLPAQVFEQSLHCVMIGFRQLLDQVFDGIQSLLVVGAF